MKPLRSSVTAACGDSKPTEICVLSFVEHRSANHKIRFVRFVGDDGRFDVAPVVGELRTNEARHSKAARYA